MALPALLFSCVREEAVPDGEDGAVHIIPYRVTVEQSLPTRATLDIIDRYIFELGDELYITYTDPLDPSKEVFGILSLVAGEGAMMATFEGELKSVGFMPSASTPLTATLVSPEDRIHTNRKNGKIGSNSAATLPKHAANSLAETFAEAVQKFSEFTGTSTFGSYTFRLEQQMSFLIFTVTFDPTRLPSEYKDGVTATITNLNDLEDGEDDFTLFSGIVPVTDHITDRQSNFVVALPSTTLNASSTLSNASIVFTYNDGTEQEAGRWEEDINQTLVKNNYYVFDETQIDADCFVIEAREDGTSITFTYTYASHGLQYSTDKGAHWNDITSDPIALNATESILVQGSSANTISGSGALFTSAGNKPCYIFGDIMTLVWGAEYDPGLVSLTASNNNLFKELFKDTNYIDIPSGRHLKMPNATTASCFQSMFEGCTSLTRAPALPAASVATSAYESMFKGCTSLTSAPELLATTVSSRGYNSMFMNCTALISAPMVLPATTTTDNCCESMFEGCTSLLTAPRLDAGTVVDRAYKRMFYGCSSLLAAPDLDAATIGISAYCQMFMGCTSMVSAPTSLRAAVLKDYCYKEMFSDCESLTNIPALPATNDVVSPPRDCYYGMFRNCQSVNSLPAGQPDLPLVKIGMNGCREMFMGCTGLVAAPQLASLTQVGQSGCYAMFRDCSELTDIPSVLKPTSIPAHAYREMFYKCPRITETPDIKATTMGENACRSMFLGCTRLHTINGELLPTTLAQYVYAYMFQGCTSLTNVPSSLLPATSLALECYRSMFQGCSALTTAPALPATSLAGSCYLSMFQGCTHLTTAPALPATTLAESCYQGMFLGCSRLTTAPKLPATTLAELCYKEMFKNCTALTGPVSLQAPVLVKDCYDAMFYNATQFTSLICLATSRETWSGDGGTGANDLNPSCNDWLNKVKATGTFYYAPGFGIKGTLVDPTQGWLHPGAYSDKIFNGIPSGWTCLEFHLEPLFPSDNPFDPEEDL